MKVANSLFRISMALLVLVAMNWPGTALAQSTGSISGQVRDSSGALIPGADVTLRNTETNLTYNALSNELGSFEFPAVQIGKYEITVKFVGFKTAMVLSFSISERIGRAN